MSLTGEIRMIKWGLIPTERYFAITVGQMVGGVENLKVTQIAKEISEDGEIVFHVECKKIIPHKPDGEPFVWKSYYKKPDEVQYFVPDEKHDYKKV